MFVGVGVCGGWCFQFVYQRHDVCVNCKNVFTAECSVCLQFLELDFMPNPPRGCSHLFGYAAIKPFLDENNLIGIIRAHQCKEEVRAEPD